MIPNHKHCSTTYRIRLQHLAQLIKKLRLKLKITARIRIRANRKVFAIKNINTQIPQVIKGMSIKSQPIQEPLPITRQKVLHTRHQFNIAHSWKRITPPRPRAALKKNILIKPDSRIPVLPIVHQTHGTMHRSSSIAILFKARRNTAIKPFKNINKVIVIWLQKA